MRISTTLGRGLSIRGALALLSACSERGPAAEEVGVASAAVVFPPGTREHLPLRPSVPGAQDLRAAVPGE
jgi:hypothetical protein